MEGKEEKLDEDIGNANSLSVIITDYRKYKYYTIDQNKLKFDPEEL